MALCHSRTHEAVMRPARAALAVIGIAGRGRPRPGRTAWLWPPRGAPPPVLRPADASRWWRRGGCQRRRRDETRTGRRLRAVCPRIARLGCGRSLFWTAADGTWSPRISSDTELRTRGINGDDSFGPKTLAGVRPERSRHHHRGRADGVIAVGAPRWPCGVQGLLSQAVSLFVSLAANPATCPRPSKR